MYSPFIVYSGTTIATSAAVLLRENDRDVRVVVEPSSTGKSDQIPLFVLQTPHEQMENSKAALKIIARQKPELLDSAYLCPSCSSPFVEFPNIPQESPSMKVIGKLFDKIDHLLSVKAARQFHCLDCDHIWTASKAETARRRQPSMSSPSPDIVR